MNNILWSDVLVVLVVFFLVWFIIAKLEMSNKVKDLFYKRTESLIGWSIAIFFVCYLVISFLEKILSDGIWVVIIILKFILAFIVSKQASIQGRNKALWFFLGLVEHFTALIVLGLSPKYFANKSLDKLKLKEINKDIQIQGDKLKALKKSNLLSTKEYEQKLILLKEDYYKIINDTLSTQLISDNSKFLSQLEQAYKEGILTEDEYQSKIKKITTN